NEIRGPIETDFGYHIIRLDGIDAAKVQPLAEVRDQVVAELRKQEAQKQFAGLAENFSNLVYENADSLDSAAAALKTKVQRSDWVTQQTVQPPLNHAAVVRSLFSAESIKSKQNTEAIEVAPGKLVAARVVEHRPSKRKPLAEVSAGIEQRLRRERIDRLMSEKGAAMMSALAKGEESGVNWSPFQMVSRQAPVGLDAAGAKAVFSVATDKLPAYTGFTRPDGTYRIVRVSRVIESPSVDPLLQSSIESGLQQAQQRADLAALVALVKAGQKVKILPNALEEQ
nr:peptidyl-prolyl cis-trans isomerase [Thiobacillaceae bacterium]